MRADIHGNYTNLDQRWFFPANNEAIGTPEFCAEEHPRVEVLDSNLVAAYETGEGKSHHSLYAGFSWRSQMPMGSHPSQLFSVSGSAMSQLVHQPEGFEDVEKQEIEVPEGSTIIWEADHMIIGHFTGNRSFDEFVREYSVFTQPRDKELPAYEGVDPYNMRFSPLGFIRPDGGLVRLGGYNNSRGLVDMVVAAKEARNRLELKIVDDVLGQSWSLVGTTSTDEAATAYLAWYRDNKSKDYVPTVDPRSMMDQFPPMSKKQYRRYERLQELNSKILHRTAEIRL